MYKMTSNNVCKPGKRMKKGQRSGFPSKSSVGIECIYLKRAKICGPVGRPFCFFGDVNPRSIAGRRFSILVVRKHRNPPRKGQIIIFH